jgi:uncharacterized protein (DUF433 family)
MNLPDFLTRDSWGEICLTGHRIGLLAVVDYYKEGHTAEEVQEEFPDLSLEHIQQALDFYRENRADVDAYVAECHAEIDRNYANYRPHPFALKVQRIVQLIQQAERERSSDPSWASFSNLDKARILARENSMEPL